MGVTNSVTPGIALDLALQSRRGIRRPTRDSPSLGTLCESADARDVKFALKCGSETEDATGFEVEEELEVEVELSEPDEADEIEDE